MIMKNGAPVAFGVANGVTIAKNDINMNNEPTITFAFTSNPGVTFTATAR